MAYMTYSTSEFTKHADGTEEIKYSEKSFKLNSEENYYKTYSGKLDYLLSLPANLLKVAMCLASHAHYANEQLQIGITADVKQVLLTELDISPKTFKNSLTQLCDGKVIFRVARSVYQINPFLFGKGKWPQIAAMRLDEKFDIPSSCTFTQVCELQRNLRNKKPVKM